MVFSQRGIRGLGVISSAVLVLTVMMASPGASSSEGQLIPSIPPSVTLENSPLFNLWTHALRNQKDNKGKLLTRDAQEVRSLLNPHPMRMVNMVPQDGPHPLYSNDYKDMRTEFLLDHMLTEAVDPADPRMAEPEGLTVATLGGKSVTFKKDGEGNISVGDLKVDDVETLPSGISLFSLSGILYDYQDRVDEARILLNKQPSMYGPMGRPKEMVAPPHHQQNK